MVKLLAVFFALIFHVMEAFSGAPVGISFGISPSSRSPPNGEMRRAVTSHMHQRLRTIARSNYYSTSANMSTMVPFFRLSDSSPSPFAGSIHYGGTSGYSFGSNGWQPILVNSHYYTLPNDYYGTPNQTGNASTQGAVDDVPPKRSAAAKNEVARSVLNHRTVYQMVTPPIEPIVEPRVDRVYETTSGRVVGWRESVRLREARDKDIIVVRNIPYAKPPIGELRFRRPQAFLPPPSLADAIVANSTTQSPRCIQSASTLSNDSEQSEDCLYLNLFIPIDNAERKAIIFIINGDGTRIENGVLAALGNVLVVSFNYRVGALSFTSEADKNVGLWDQHLALQWVRDNAGVFNGDARRITVMGASEAVSHHLLSSHDAEEELFSGAILQSDPAAFSRKSVLNAFHRLAVAFGCVPDPAVLDFQTREYDADVMACMRSVDVLELRDRVDGIGVAPLIDGDSVLDRTREIIGRDDASWPMSIVDSGAVDKRIRIMVGIASDEGAHFPHFVRNAPLAMSDELYDEFVGALATRFLLANRNPETTDFGTTVRGLQYLYRQDRKNYLPSANVLSEGNATLAQIRNYRRVMDFFGDLFAMPTVLFATRLMEISDSVFLYQVDREENATLSDFYPHPSPYQGSSHVDEIISRMGSLLLEDDVSTPTRPSDRFYENTAAARRITRRLLHLWSNFAKNGRPSEPNESTRLLRWPPSPAFYTLRADERREPISDFSDYRPRVVAFWRDLLPTLIRSDERSTKECVCEAGA